MRIRQGNDFIFLWAIERNELPEDFSNAVNIRLHFKNFDCVGDVKSFQIVDGNIVRVEVSPEWASRLGAYRLILSYELEDESYYDGDQKCVVDVLAFNIVPKTSEADDVTEMAKTTDIMIGLKGDKGDPFTYDDFTPEQIEDLKRPAIEAAETANTAAQNADDARLAIQDDLALKANKIQEEWIVPTLAAGWIQDDASDTMSIGYMKDNMGFVHLRGRIKNGVLGGNAFSLPIGYRPINDIRFPLVSNDSFGYIRIRKAGNCYLYGSNVFVDLGEIIFRV